MPQPQIVPYRRPQDDDGILPPWAYNDASGMAALPPPPEPPPAQQPRPAAPMPPPPGPPPQSPAPQGPQAAPPNAPPGALGNAPVQQPQPQVPLQYWGDDAKPPQGPPQGQPSRVDQAIQALGPRPQRPNENWAQKVARVILSATKFAPETDLILHPNATMQAQRYQGGIQNIAQQEQLRQQEALAQQEESKAAQLKAQGEDYPVRENERKRRTEEEAAAKAAQASAKKESDYWTDLGRRTKGRDYDVLQEGDPRIAELQKQGYSIEPIPLDSQNGRVAAIPPAFVRVTSEMANERAGIIAGTVIPWSEAKEARQNVFKQQQTEAKPEKIQLTPEQRIAARSMGLDPNNYENWTAEQNAKLFSKLKPPQVPAPGLTPEAIAGIGTMFGKTGQLPNFGMGKDAATMRANVLNSYFKGDPDGDPVLAGAIFSADKASLNKLQSNRDAVVTFENTAGRNLDLFLNQAKKIVDSGSQWINKPLRAVDRAGLGSADQAAYDAARRVALSEIAKVVSNPNLTGQLSDSARHEVDTLVPESATLQQAYRVAGVLKQDMENRRIEYDKTLAEVKGRLGGNKNGAQPNAPPATAPTQPKITHRFNPATGKIEAVTNAR